MTRIVIVRHGNTFDKGDTVTRVGARTDLPLSSSGEAQASALSTHFKQTPFAAAFCSPLLRTKQTAREILAPHFGAPSLLIAPFLTEIDYGPDENRPEPDVIARIGEDAIAAWDADATPPPGWSVDPGVITAAWKALFKRAAELPEDANVLIVTSNGIARFVLDAVYTLPAGTDRKLKTGAWGEVKISPKGHAQLVGWNQRP